MIKRIIIIIFLLGLVATGIVVWQIITPEGKRIGVLRGIIGSTQLQLEQWIGTQLKAIANDYLKPELHFTQIRYEAPGTVFLHDVTLVSEAETLLALDRLTVTLAEIPRVGRPIVIETITLDAPTLRFLQREDGLLGWEDLVEGGAGEVKPDGGSTRLSDVFAINRILINDASIAYKHAEKPPMRLDGISLDLQSDGERDDGGWHSISTELERDHLLDMDIEGRVNLDSFTLDLESVMLRAGIDEDSYQLFPPNLQTFLAEHKVRGVLEIGLDGQITLSDIPNSTMSLHASLLNAFATSGEYTMPIQSFDLSVAMSSGIVTIDQCVLAALGGTASADATVDLAPEGAFEINMDAMGMRIEEALTTRIGSTGNPKFAGRVDMRGAFGGATRQPIESVFGQGLLAAREGRFGDLPVIGNIIRVVAGLKPGARYSDQLTTNFTIREKQLRLRDIDLRSTAVAARGQGEINFDRTINLRLNAGPLESVENKLGKIGKVIGRITDKLVTYQVRGTLAKPTVEVKPLGFGVISD